MANFWMKTASRYRRPLACFSAFVAGCLLAGFLAADERVTENRAVASEFDGLFDSGEIKFSPVPPLEPTAIHSPAPLRNPTQPASSPINRPAAVSQPMVGGPSVNELLGEIKQQGFQRPAETTAKMVIPVNNAVDPKPSAPPQNEFRPSLTREAPASKKRPLSSLYQASLANWQESNSGSRNQSAASVARFSSVGNEATSGSRWTGVHRLRNISIDEFEASVVRIWNDRIQTSSSHDGRYVRVEFPTRLRERMMMTIDRHTETLTYEGDDVLRDNWHELVTQIDSLPKRLANGNIEQTMLVDRNRAEMATVHQATFLMGMAQDITQPGQVRETLPRGTVLPQDVQIPKGTQGIKNTVKILQDPETGVITLVGDPEDLKIVKEIIAKISKEAEAKQPNVERIPLNNIQSEAIAERLQEIYDQSYSASKGSAQIEPLAIPNSLIVVGQPQGIAAIKQLVATMDAQAGELEASGFKSFQLKHLSAADAKSRLDSYFNKANVGEGANLPSAPVTVIADYRSNTIVVKGAVQFIRQAEQFLATIDVSGTGKVNTVKIFPLRNTLAEDMAIVLQDAINGQQPNSGAGFNPNQAAQQAQQNNQGQVSPTNSSIGSAQLSLKTIDPNGRVVNGGIMFDVRVTADRNSNSLVVTGPQESMELVEALIKQLDRVPDAETQIKVFEIINGDAETLLSMLENLFGTDQTQGGGQQNTTNLSQLPLQGVSATDGSTLVNIRFSVDTRTNTIIASGPAGDLQVVEALLNRLDERDVIDRRPRVYRLSNAPAIDVAEAINAYLDPRQDIINDDPRTVGAYLQTDRAVIVVPEVVSNSLIVSAGPEDRLEIEELIRGLDRRPTMVKVKVLIAQVDLNQLEEFGVQIGVQDSLLFDRGTSVAADGSITDGSVGFPFNGSPPAVFPNQNATFPETLAAQALSNLGLGTVNTGLGYGGLVLSAGNESINILIRALKDKQAIRVLSKPHITTVENLQGRVTVGQSVPRVGGTTISGLNTIQDIDNVDVGIILEMTPRVSPDGMIVMALNIVKSRVGSDEEGTVVGFDNVTGQPILSPPIDQIEAQTTLMARSGQTVVFSGLIEETKSHVERGAPILSDLPWIGPLFKFEGDETSRKELLIFLTPYIVDSEMDMDTQNQDEMERMHWCLCDVAEVYGNTDYRRFDGTEASLETIYPDADPTGRAIYPVINAPQPLYKPYPPQSRAGQPNPAGKHQVQQAFHSTGNQDR